MPEELVPRVEALEHTADAGIVVYARTLAELFELAARGMCALMVDPESVDEREMWAVDVEGSDLPALLAAWLEELLFLTDVRGAVFHSFHVESIEANRVCGLISGERLDPRRHPLGVGVKAVTHHGLEVCPVAGGYRARILFDI